MILVIILWRIKMSDSKQGFLFYGGNEKRFDTEMKKRSFRDKFLGIRYSNVMQFCEALYEFSKKNNLSYKEIVLDYMLITKNELKNRFHSEESACIAVCGTSADFGRNKNKLKGILSKWSHKNCDAANLCSLLAPHFAMDFTEREGKLIYFRTKKEFANKHPVSNGFRP